MIKLLWIALPLPGCMTAAAGHATFRYYFNEFYADSRFEITEISYESSDGLERSLKDFPFAKLINIDSKGVPKYKKLVNLESKLNPFNRHGNTLSNWVEIRLLQELQILSSSGYNPDVVILDWTSSVMLAGHIKELFPSSKIIASEHDVTFVGYERMRDRHCGLLRVWHSIRFKQEKNAELSALEKCDFVLTHNMDNVNLLKNEGIQSEKLHWLVPYYKNMEIIERKPMGKNLLFFGAMDRPANYLSVLWFAKNVMPLLPDSDLRLLVLGGRPHRSLYRINDKRIQIIGFVEDISPYFESCACLVAPLVLGAGIKIKVLEAMSAAVPVLTNKIGIEGIRAKDCVQYLRCETPEDYAGAVRWVLQNPDEATNIGLAARKYVAKTFSYWGFSKRYRNLVAGLANTQACENGVGSA